MLAFGDISCLLRIGQSLAFIIVVNADFNQVYVICVATVSYEKTTAKHNTISATSTQANQKYTKNHQNFEETVSPKFSSTSFRILF